MFPVCSAIFKKKKKEENKIILNRQRKKALDKNTQKIRNGRNLPGPHKAPTKQNTSKIIFSGERSNALPLRSEGRKIYQLL